MNEQLTLNLKHSCVYFFPTDEVGIDKVTAMCRICGVPKTHLTHRGADKKFLVDKDWYTVVR